MADICHCQCCSDDTPTNELEAIFCGCILDSVIYGIKCDCLEQSRAAKLELMARPQIPKATSSLDYLLTPRPGVIACGRGQKCEAFALEDDMFLWHLPIGSPGMVGELCGSMAEVATIVGRDESELPRFAVAPAIESSLGEEYGKTIMMAQVDIASLEIQLNLLGLTDDFDLAKLSAFYDIRVIHDGDEAYVVESNVNDTYSVTRFRTVAEAVDYIRQVTGEP